MAMYYYARRLQKASKKNKILQRDPIINNSNGSIPSIGIAICTPSNKKVVEEIVPSPPSPSQQSPANSSKDGAITRKSLPSPNSQVELFPGKKSLGKAVNHHVINGSLVFEDGHLVSGTLDGLVDYLVPSEDHYPETAFLFAFILTSRMFIRPHQLLATVFHRAFQDRSEDESTRVEKLVKLLGEWIRIFPYDFRDDRGLMMANVRAITHKCVHLCPSLKKEVSILLTSLLDKLTLLEKFEMNLAKINLEVQMGSNHGMILGEQSRLINLCPNPNLLAQQLTLVELERLFFLGPQELIQAFVKEPLGSSSPSPPTPCSSSIPSPNPLVNSNGTPNGINNNNSSSSGPKLRKSRLESYVEWFHRLSVSVATDVCKTLRKKERTRTLEYWVKVGSHCVTLSNFNSAIAIYTGLNSASVRRLIKTWSKFGGRDELSVLEQCCNPANNFATYRSLLKGGGGSGIPFFSLLISDLFLLTVPLKEAAKEARVPNGHHHLYFSNFLQLSTTVGEVIFWQQQKPEFNRVAHLLHVIQTLPSLGEDALMLASFECEAPFTPQEKREHEALLLKLEQEGPPPGGNGNGDEEGLTDSFQSLPLPSTSSGSTSGVFEESTNGPGMSPTELHKLLNFRFNSSLGQPNDILSTAKSTLRGLGVGVVDVQVHQTNGASNKEGKVKVKPPVPLRKEKQQNL